MRNGNLFASTASRTASFRSFAWLASIALVASILIGGIAGALISVPEVAVSKDGSVPKPDATFVETRYLRGVANEETENGLTAYALNTTQSATQVQAPNLGKNQIFAGIRVWTRTNAGVETELTAGTAVGIATRGAGLNGAMVAGATWTPAATAMAVTDSIVVRLYQGIASPPANQVGEFTTGPLGAAQLDSVAWAPSYYLFTSNAGAAGNTRVWWGDATGNTNIANFQYTTPADLVPPTANAGPDQAANAGALVTFDGSGSTDNVGITNYWWNFTDGAVQSLTGVGPTYTFNTPGVYNVNLTVMDAAGLKGNDTVVINVTDTSAPATNAGPDQTVDEDTLVTFDGSGSTDNVGIVNYWWNFTDGLAKSLAGVGPTYTFANVSAYTVTLTCMDVAGNKGTDTVVITTLDATAPVANAGIDQTVNQGATVTFDGSLSTDNIGIANYWWNFTDGGAQSLSGVGPAYVFNNPAVFTVTLTCMDAAGNKGTDAMTVTVNAFVDVTAPTADAGPDQSVTAGETVTFNGSLSTDDIGIVHYWWNFTDGAAKSLAGVGPTYAFVNVSVYTVTLTCMDAAGNNGTDTVTITTTADTSAPVANAGPDQIVDEDALVTFDGSGSSDNVGIVNYWWNFTDGLAKSLAGVGPTYTFANVSAYTVTLTCMDAAGNKGTDTVVITTLDATAPVANASVDQTVNQGATVTFDGSASSDNVGVTNYWWNFTDGAAQSLTGVSPSYLFSNPAVILVTLTVMDAVGLASVDTMTVTVNVFVDVTPPAASAGPDQGVTAGALVTFDGSGSTDDVGIASYAWTFFDGANKTLAGANPTYTFANASAYAVTLNVTDAAGNWDTDVVNITVSPLNLPPAAAAGPDITVKQGAVFIFNGSASSDIDGSIANYTWNMYASNWTHVATEFGAVVVNNGTVLPVGVYHVNLTVTDDLGATGTDSLVVNMTDGLAPLVNLTGAPSSPVNQGDWVVFTANATDNVANATSMNYTWFVDGVHIASGINVTQLNYTFADAGTHLVRVDVTDGDNNTGSAELAYAVNDTANPSVTVSPATATIDEGGYVVFTCTATDNVDTADLMTYTWFVDGLQVLTGVNETELNHTFAASGVHTVFCEVEDAAGNVANDTATVTANDITPPTVAISASPASPQGSGTVVNFTAVASENVTYLWSLDGSATAITTAYFVHNFTAPGTYNVSVEVTDTAGNVGTDYVLYVINDITDPTADAGADQAVAAGATVTFDGSASVDDVGVANYTWTFVDGANVTLYGVGPTHVFATVGSFMMTLTVADAAGNTATDTMYVNVTDQTAPVANAGPDQTVNEDALVTFDGSGCTDNVGIVQYWWNFTDGVAQTLTGASPTYTFSTPGFYPVTLTIEDAAGNSATDAMTVTVTDQTAPVANAGSDQTVPEDTVVSFDGSSSADNLGVVNWTWTIDDNGANVTLFGAFPEYSFAVPGVYEVMLTVKDSSGHDDSDNLTVNVTDVTAPVAAAGADQSVDEDTVVTFNGAGSTDNVGIVLYTWTFTDGTARTLTGINPTYTFATPTSYVVTLTVEDAGGNTDSDAMVVTVADVTAPTITICEADETNISPGGEVVFMGDATDLQTISFQWTITDADGNFIADYQSSSATHTFDEAGVYTATFEATDASGNSVNQTLTITVSEDVEEDEGGLCWLWALLILIVIVLIVAVVVVLLFFRVNGKKDGDDALDDAGKAGATVPATEGKEAAFVAQMNEDAAADQFECPECKTMVDATAEKCPGCGAEFATEEEELPDSPKDE